MARAIEQEKKRQWHTCGAAKTSKELAEWPRLQRKNLNILGLPKTKEWPQCHKKAVGKYARAAFAKGEMKSAICPKHQIVRRESVKVSKNRTFTREKGIKAGTWR